MLGLLFVFATVHRSAGEWLAPWCRGAERLRTPKSLSVPDDPVGREGIRALPRPGRRTMCSRRCLGGHHADEQGALDTERCLCYHSGTDAMSGEERGIWRGGCIEWNNAAARHIQRRLSAQSRQTGTFSAIPVESAAAPFCGVAYFPFFSGTWRAEQPFD
jgi:hypothetical protein